MAGYNADGTILLHPGGYWYLLEFHKKDTIADYTNRKDPVPDTIWSMEICSAIRLTVLQKWILLDGAMQYDNGDDEPDIPGRVEHGWVAGKLLTLRSRSVEAS